MGSPTRFGPDIVIAGAVRSGTSTLAAVLGARPDVDRCALDEPNYFSQEHERGPDWYDGLFRSRTNGTLRLDASTSYTYPHFPDALPRLAAVAPQAFVVYMVRDPLARTLAHYQSHRDDIGIETAPTFGDGLASNPVYLGTSEYDHWITVLHEHFPAEQVLVVPYDVVARRREAVVDAVCRSLGLPPPAGVTPVPGARSEDAATLRRGAVPQRRRLLMGRGAVSRGRRLVRGDRLARVWRRRGPNPSPEGMPQALATCGPAQLNQLSAMHRSSRAAVAVALRAQDVRLDLDWADVWERSCPDGEPLALTTRREGGP